MKRRVAVFVDGAYWHGHPDFVRPDASEYWQKKIARTKERDRAADRTLEAGGWVSLRFWDFEVAQDTDGCVSRVIRALEERREGRL